MVTHVSFSFLNISGPCGWGGPNLVGGGWVTLSDRHSERGQARLIWDWLALIYPLCPGGACLRRLFGPLEYATPAIIV